MWHRNPKRERGIGPSLTFRVRIGMQTTYVDRCNFLGIPTRLLAGLLLCLLVCGGCFQPPDAEFSLSERTKGLSQPARTGYPEEQIPGLEDRLADRFGTPNVLHAWMRLPVNYGGHIGKVVEVTGEAGLNVSFGTDVETFQDEDRTLTVMSGDHIGETIPVSAYSAESALIQTSGSGPALAAGDRIVLDFGATLSAGRRDYMTHCVHCHGTGGDGNGPTAQYLNPRPRDYRSGVFKFGSTARTSRISRDDLGRIIRNGIPGTYMPSFMLLPDDELTAITEYVRWLAMRGEYERAMVIELESDFSKEAVKGTPQPELRESLTEFLQGEFEEMINESADLFAEAWKTADTDEVIVRPDVPRVPDTPESRHRGRMLFLSDKTKCANCHGERGRGDGPQTQDYADNPLTRKKYPEPGLHDAWGQVVKPRDLTTGIYRGGRRPIDLFRRIHDGINGTPMPENGKVLKDEEVWDLVNFVLSMPFEGRPAVPDTAGRMAHATQRGVIPGELPPAGISTARQTTFVNPGRAVASKPPPATR